MSDGFHPFRYGQCVKWLETTADATAQEYYHTAKVQGTVGSKPEYLFVVDAAGKGHEVLKARLLDNEPAEEVDEGGGDRCDFTDRFPLKSDLAPKYDNGEPVMLGDLIASESGVPGRVVELVEGVKATVGCVFNGNDSVYFRLSKGLQFVERGTLTPVLSVPEAPLTLGHSGLDPITKDTNPKDALAGFKPRWFSFVPLRVLVGVGKAMFEGGWKYGKHNYRESGVRATVYVDATVCGHLMPWMEGQDYDENGMHHIDKAIASLMVLRDAQLGGNWIDDRPLAAAGFDEQMERETAHFQQMKAELQKKFGDPVAPFTEATRGQPRAKK